MSKYYCRIDDMRGGFFDPLVHGEIGSLGCKVPEDAREITDEQHEVLLRAQGNGKLIVPDPAGYPIAIDPPPPDVEELAAIERAWRDAQLALTDPLVSRHRDELEEGGATSLASEQYAELQAYRRQLRDWPQGSKFPLAEHRPIAPPWLIEQVQ